MTAATAVLGLGAAVLPTLSAGPSAPPPTSTGVGVATAASFDGAAAPADGEGRRLAPTVCGRVIDPAGATIAGVRVAMDGVAEVVETGTDGVFAFAVPRRGRCAALPAPGWLPVDTPLLALCQAGWEPVLVMAPCAELHGRVLDPDGGAVAGARVAVQLDIALPGRGAVEGLRIVDGWAAATDADGRYRLPVAPIGAQARLSIAAAGFAVAEFDLGADASALRLVHLQPEPARPTTTGTAANADDATASVPGELSGQLITEGVPCAGWWVAPVSTAPLGESGPWGRYAAPPTRTLADGRFAFTVAEGAYRIEAWEARNAAAFRSTAVSCPAVDLAIEVRAQRPPADIRGRVVDDRGAPVGGVCVGLARPTAWAGSGAVAMHSAARTTTDGAGNFALAPGDLVGLELIVDGVRLMPLRTPIVLGESRADIELRTAGRRWLDATPWAVAGTAPAPLQLAAVDPTGRGLPLWDSGPALPRSSLPWSPGRIGVPQTASRLILQGETGELGWLRLRP